MYKKWTQVSVAAWRNVSTTAQGIIARFAKFTWGIPATATRKAVPAAIALNASEVGEVFTVWKWSLFQVKFFATLKVKFAYRQVVAVINNSNNFLPSVKNFTAQKAQLHYAERHNFTVSKIQFHPKGSKLLPFFVKIYRIDNFLSICVKSLAFYRLRVYNGVTKE